MLTFYKTIISLLLACAVWLPASGAPVKVFILTGQSNMVGFGKSTEITQSDGIPVEFTKVRYYSALEGVTDPITIKSTLKKGTYQSVMVTKPSGTFFISSFGPELGIAKVLTAKYPNEQLVLVKVTKGGTSLADNWIKDVDSVYSWFKSKVGEAMKDIETKYGKSGYGIAGVFWMQGEADACFPEMASIYSDNLKYFADSRLRPFLNTYPSLPVNGSIPFIYGEIHTGWPIGLVVLQEQYKGQSKIPCVRCMTGSRTATRWDENPVDQYETGAGFSGAHYNTQGTLKVGIDFGNAYLALIAGNQGLGCPDPHTSYGDVNNLLQIIQ